MTKSDEARALIATHSPRIGAGTGDDALRLFLSHLADDLDAATYSNLFGMRFKEHVAHAIRMISSNYPLDPPAAIGSAFLLTRFELLFRQLSGVLACDGTWLNGKSDQCRAIELMNDRRLRKSRIQDAGLAYRLMINMSESPASHAFQLLDSTIHAVPQRIQDYPHPINNTGDRISAMRNAVAHGFFSDPSAEGPYYALLMAIIFYNQ